MTREEVVAKWETLKPRQRDAWIAEVIFGATLVTDGVVYTLTGGYNYALPPYTSDISLAWPVLERMNAEHYVRIDRSSRGKWTCDGGGWCVESDSAPEAIGLAALITKLTYEDGGGV